MTRMIDMMDRFPLQPKHEVPFRFFERDGRGVPPLVKLPYEVRTARQSKCLNSYPVT